MYMIRHHRRFADQPAFVFHCDQSIQAQFAWAGFRKRSKAASRIQILFGGQEVAALELLECLGLRINRGQ